MEFKQSVITTQGRSLMAKLLTGSTTATFTKIATSSKVYTDVQLAGLATLGEVQQTTTVQVKANNSSTITAEGGIENTGIKAGYYINTIGLYAKEAGKSEILYSVASAKVNGYIPADIGVSKTGVVIKIYTEIGNADQVNLVVDPGATATINNINDLNKRIDQSNLFTAVGSTRNLNLGSLSNDDFPSFRAFLYQYGAGVAQPGDGYFGVKQTSEVPIQAQFTNANGTVQFLINNELVKKYCPDFNFNTISTTFSSDKKWIYLNSGISTVGIRSENVTFK